MLTGSPVWSATELHLTPPSSCDDETWNSDANPRIMPFKRLSPPRAASSPARIGSRFLGAWWFRGSRVDKDSESARENGGMIVTKGSWILWAVRAGGLVIIAVMAIGVARSASPTAAILHEGAFYNGSGGEIALARLNDKANAKNTDNVYQQQVVNGWVARDYLEVQAKQLDKIGKTISDPTYVMPGPADNRPVMMLLWAVLAIVWLGLTTPGAWPRRVAPTGAGPQPGSLVQAQTEPPL